MEKHICRRSVEIFAKIKYNRNRNLLIFQYTKVNESMLRLDTELNHVGTNGLRNSMAKSKNNQWVSFSRA